LLRSVVSARDAEIIERVVAAAAGWQADRGESLAEICRFYEPQHTSKER
jgi:hypothetical protein